MVFLRVIWFAVWSFQRVQNGARVHRNHGTVAATPGGGHRGIGRVAFFGFVRVRKKVKRQFEFFTRGGRAFFPFSNDAVGRGQKWKYARTSATRKTNFRSKRANARIDISFVRNLFSPKEQREKKNVPLLRALLLFSCSSKKR